MEEVAAAYWGYSFRPSVSQPPTRINKGKCTYQGSSESSGRDGENNGEDGETHAEEGTRSRETVVFLSFVGLECSVAESVGRLLQGGGRQGGRGRGTGS